MACYNEHSNVLRSLGSDGADSSGVDILFDIDSVALKSPDA